MSARNLWAEFKAFAMKGNMIDLGYPDGVPSDWRTGWVDIYILGN